MTIMAYDHLHRYYNDVLDSAHTHVLRLETILCDFHGAVCVANGRYGYQKPRKRVSWYLWVLVMRRNKQNVPRKLVKIRGRPKKRLLARLNGIGRAMSYG